MSIPVPEQMNQLGIKIQLTKKGNRNLALILEQGCPIKMVDNEIRPIRCYNKNDPTWSCYKCWYYWLHTHAEIKEDIQNVSATCKRLLP